jgi:transcriptional regulator with XRE-family HTH domain
MIGNNIKKRRLELGMTQEELAHKMGYKSRSAINKLEKNVNDINQSTLKKLGKALDINPVDLMEYGDGGKIHSDFMLYSINKADGPHLANNEAAFARLSNYAHLFASLSDSNKDIIIQTMKAMGATEEKKPTDALKGYLNGLRGMSDENREKR